MCFDISDLSSITIKKSLTTPTYSGNPTFPVPFLEAVFNASLTSFIEHP